MNRGGGDYRPDSHNKILRTYTDSSGLHIFKLLNEMADVVPFNQSGRSLPNLLVFKSKGRLLE